MENLFMTDHAAPAPDAHDKLNICKKSLKRPGGGVVCHIPSRLPSPSPQHVLSFPSLLPAPSHLADIMCSLVSVVYLLVPATPLPLSVNICSCYPPPPLSGHSQVFVVYLLYGPFLALLPDTHNISLTLKYSENRGTNINNKKWGQTQALTLKYCLFHIKGTWSVHSFNGDYLSIPGGTGSCGYLFHEIPGI